jgi:hypothetical protein
MRAVEIANAVYRSSTERRVVRVDEPFWEQVGVRHLSRRGDSHKKAQKPQK